MNIEIVKKKKPYYYGVKHKKYVEGKNKISRYYYFYCIVIDTLEVRISKTDAMRIIKHLNLS